MDLDLKGRVALICGGSRGIGRVVAEAFAAEGASVAIAARTEKRLEEVAADLRVKYGVKVLPVAADLSRPEEVERFVSAALTQLDRIDILVNVAGNAPTGRLNELSDGQWAAAFELKFMGGCAGQPVRAAGNAPPGPGLHHEYLRRGGLGARAREYGLLTRLCSAIRMQSSDDLTVSYDDFWYIVICLT